MDVVAEADAVVIGGGASGSSTAYYLSKAGKKVILVEKGLIAGEASGRNGGFTMQMGRAPRLMSLAQLAVRLWPTIEEETGHPTEWRRSGGLCVALNDYEWQIMNESLTPQQAGGLQCEIVDAATCLELVPALTNRVIGGFYVPGDGNANPVIAVKSIARGAKDRGAEIWEQTEAVGLQIDDGQVKGVDTSRGRIRTNWVALCGGPWSSFLGAWAGISLPVVPLKIQIAITEPVAPQFEPYLVGNHLYIRQAIAGNIHFGGGGPPREGVMLAYDKANTETTLQRSARDLRDLLPKLQDLLVLRAWAGVMEALGDGPIVGPADTPRGLVVACGFDGNGFGLGPGTGKVMSELILGEPLSADISQLNIERYQGIYTPSDRERRTIHETWFARPEEERRQETGAWAVTGVRPVSR
jgi:sarcosine oxidase subunit beta